MPDLIDDLTAFIATRMGAATRDKAMYDRNGARLNGQLLQGEINMGTAVLAWLEKARAGASPAVEEEEEAEEADAPE
jgi:hypothetical protein